MTRDGDETQSPPSPTGLAVILFSDLVDSTALLSRLGDQRMHELQSAHIADTQRAVEAYGGVFHKSMGDGAMASFSSAVGALAASATIVRDVQALNERESEPGLAVRVGVSIGEPIVEAGDLQGLAVVIAARLCAAAGPNDVLVADTVRGLVQPRQGFAFGTPSSFQLKGITAQVDASFFDWRTHTAPAPHPARVDGSSQRQLTETTRVSDRDREAVAERLRMSAAQGQLTFGELEDRVASAFAAVTVSDLRTLTADLSTAPLTVSSEGGSAALEVRRTVSIMGGNSRAGRWRPARSGRVLSLMGSAEIDLTHAQFAHPTTTLRVLAFWGGAKVVVPDGVEVHLEKLPLAGGITVRLGHDEPPPGAPILHLKLKAIMGGITVVRSGAR